MAKIIDFIICESNCWLKILTLTSILFIFLGLLLPPVGVVDNSILIGIGELEGFAVIGETTRAIQSGHSAKIKIKEMEMEIKNNNIKNENQD